MHHRLLIANNTGLSGITQQKGNNIMTTEDAKRIKAVVMSEAKFKTYFNSKTGELRVKVASYYDGENIPTDIVKRNVSRIANALTVCGMRPKYRIETIRYQGFINNVTMVF